jgi:hypothetical protein
MTYWLTVESPLTGRMVSMEIHSSEEKIKGYILMRNTRPKEEVPPIGEVFPNLTVAKGIYFNRNFNIRAR